MSLTAKIQKEVSKAFKRIGDLAVPVLLVQRVNSNFDFATKTPVLGSPVNTTVKGVLLSTGRTGGNNNRIQTDNPSVTRKLLLDATAIADPDIYDKVEISGETWNIVPPYVSNGFTITLSLVREA
jgi:hypothetical protein